MIAAGCARGSPHRRTVLRLWIPRSWAAAAVFFVLVWVMATPVSFVLYVVLIAGSECFLNSCSGPNPVTAVVAGGLGVLLMLVPFAGVRLFQGGPGERMGGMWSEQELERIGAAEELEVAVVTPEGGVRKAVPVWVVRVGDQVFVRTWHRRETGWYGRALTSRRARVTVPGVEADVTVEVVRGEQRDAVDAAYSAKYARYGSGSVDPMTTEEAVATTLRLNRT